MLDFIGVKYMPLHKDKRPVLSGWGDDGFTVGKDKMEGHQLGILTGKRSGITVVDIDFHNKWGKFGVEPGTFPETYTVQTPTGALQKYYMYESRIGQSQKSFEKMPSVDIRNDGGYVMAPPSEADYEKTIGGETRRCTNPYKVISGDILNLSPFPFHLFEGLIAEKKTVTDLTPYTPKPSRPGDDFESATSWEQILCPFGFVRGHTDRKGVTHWTRPGKKGDATSATTMMCTDGRERLFVFSTNAHPFESYEKEKHNSYSKFSAFSLINHGGDFKKTASDLREQGYGVQEDVVLKVTPSVAPFKTPQDAPGSIEMTCVADLVEEPIDWLWKGKIARGELCIIAGEPGASKTMVAIDLASRVTHGSNEPLGYNKMCKGSVLFLTSENHPTKVMRPRLVAAGADLTKVHILASSITETDSAGKKKNKHIAIAEDAEKIGQAMSTIPDVVMLVIDPISEYMGKKDSNNNADVRDMLATLTEHVRDKNVAVLAIAHFNKKSEVTTATSRINGSIGFAGAARTAFAVGKNFNSDWTEEDQEKHYGEKVFSCVKNNLSGDVGGYIYKVEGYEYEVDSGVIDTARIAWVEQTEDSADDMLAKTSKKGRPSVEGDKCREWLTEILKANPGGIKRNDVIDMAGKSGFSQVMVDRVSRGLLLDKKERGVWKLISDLNNEAF